MLRYHVERRHHWFRVRYNYNWEVMDTGDDQFDIYSKFLLLWWTRNDRIPCQHSIRSTRRMRLRHLCSIGQDQADSSRDCDLFLGWPLLARTTHSICDFRPRTRMHLGPSRIWPELLVVLLALHAFQQLLDNRAVKWKVDVALLPRRLRNAEWLFPFASFRRIWSRAILTDCTDLICDTLQSTLLLFALLNICLSHWSMHQCSAAPCMWKYPTQNLLYHHAWL